MRIDIISLFPQMFEALTDHGVVGRAIQRRILCLNYWNPRDYADNRHKTIDDRPYGGGPGMVMQYQPLSDAISRAKQQNPKSLVIYLSPQGKPLNQQTLQRLATCPGLTLLNGRYEGVDERLIEQTCDEECSIGDYVISGGELAAMVLIDGIARLLPGVLGHEASAEQDSYANGLLDCPHYTRPENIENKAVPSVLLSGDHQAIARWRMKQSLGRTWLRRPDLLNELDMSKEQQDLLDEFIRESNLSR
ncbi:MAG TPA: tRNA (guanosine(37)-N1)-methyltransferase TrmD [Gammaproteobacteria bacterium]|nr:tRNA (guanosine(37)-N1)-methyltransferase TrmD [Gammaproteobacteria bacterium]